MKEKVKITLEDFNKRLLKHDWFFQASDDARVYRKGAEEDKTLVELSLQSKKHEELYAKHYRKHFPVKK